MQTIGVPATGIAAVTALVFVAINSLVPASGWPTFVIAVVLASWVYPLPAAAILLGKQRTFETLKKVFPGARRE